MTLDIHSYLSANFTEYWLCRMSRQKEYGLMRLIASLKRFCTQDFCRKYKLCCDSYVNLFLELWSFSGFLLSYALLLCISAIRKNLLKGTPLYTNTIFIGIWFQFSLLSVQSHRKQFSWVRDVRDL